MSLALELRLTDPAAPLFIDIEGDAVDILFVISTSQVPGIPTTSSQRNSQSVNTRKRDREQSVNETPRIKKAMKAVQPAGLETLQSRCKSNFRSGTHTPGSMPPPSFIPNRGISQSHELGQNDVQPSFGPPPSVKQRDPLFLPSSQMSTADEEVLRATGLGVESMDAHELADLLEGEGEEVDFSSQREETADNNMDEQDSLELFEEIEFSATQSSHSGDRVCSFLSLVGALNYFYTSRCSNPCSKTSFREFYSCNPGFHVSGIMSIIQSVVVVEIGAVFWPYFRMPKELDLDVVTCIDFLRGAFLRRFVIHAEANLREWTPLFPPSFYDSLDQNLVGAIRVVTQY